MFVFIHLFNYLNIQFIRTENNLNTEEFPFFLGEVLFNEEDLAGQIGNNNLTSNCLIPLSNIKIITKIRILWSRMKIGEHFLAIAELMFYIFIGNPNNSWKDAKELVEFIEGDYSLVKFHIEDFNDCLKLEENIEITYNPNLDKYKAESVSINIGEVLGSRYLDPLIKLDSIEGEVESFLLSATTNKQKPLHLGMTLEHKPSKIGTSTPSNESPEIHMCLKDLTFELPLLIQGVPVVLKSTKSKSFHIRDASEKTIKSLNGKLKIVEKKIIEHQNAREEQAVNPRITEGETFENSLLAHSLKLHKLVSEGQEVKRDYEKLLNDTNIQKMEYEDKLKRLSSINEQGIEAQVDEFKKKIAEKEESLKKAHRDLQAVRQENAELTKNNFDLTQKNKFLKEENAKVKAANSELGHKNSEVKAGKSALEDRHNKIKEVNVHLWKENSDLIKVNSNIIEEIAELTKDNSRLREENTKLNEANNNLEEGAETFKKEIAKLKTDNSHLSEENGNTKEENAGLKQVANNLKKLNTSLKESKKTLKEEIEKTKTENTKLKEEKASVKEKNQQLIRDIDENKSTHEKERLKQMEIHRVELAEKEKAFEDINTLVEILKTENSKLKEDTHGKDVANNVGDKDESNTEEKFRKLDQEKQQALGEVKVLRENSKNLVKEKRAAWIVAGIMLAVLLFCFYRVFIRSKGL